MAINRHSSRKMPNEFHMQCLLYRVLSGIVSEEAMDIELGVYSNLKTFTHKTQTIWMRERIYVCRPPMKYFFSLGIPHRLCSYTVECIGCGEYGRAVICERIRMIRNHL